ncbi:MAG: hypothetical protein ABI366_04865 [Ginsengibacter sp.]
MKKLFSFMPLFILAILISGCPKPCIEANYTFAVNSQITPDLDSVHIGDTLYLTSSFSSSLKDKIGGAIVDYSNANNINSTLGIGIFVDGNKIPNDAVFNFDYFSIKGGVYNDRNVASPDGTQQLIYQELNGKYELKIGLIPKIKGIYGLGVGDGLSTGRSGVKGCQKATFSISLNNTNQHFYIYQNIDNGHQITDYEQKHAYYFVVK